MKRILITLSALLLSMTAGYAQKNMFEKMPPNQRDSILIETAKNAVLKYAPGYYRDYKKPEVILKKTVPLIWCYLFEYVFLCIPGRYDQ